MQVMSDMELNELALASPPLRAAYTLPPDLLLDSAKFSFLRTELPRLRAEVTTVGVGGGSQWPHR